MTFKEYHCRRQFCLLTRSIPILRNGTLKFVSVEFLWAAGPVLSVINLLALLLQSLLCSYCVGMPLMIFDDAHRVSPEILEQYVGYKLFEINRLIAINIWQLGLID